MTAGLRFQPGEGFAPNQSDTAVIGAALAPPIRMETKFPAGPERSSTRDVQIIQRATKTVGSVTIPRASRADGSAIAVRDPAAPGATEVLNGHELLTTKEAAAYTTYTPHGLENLRSAGKGPAFIKAQGGAVAYRLADLLAWQQQRRISTLDQD